jgi:hypothetical protein
MEGTGKVGTTALLKLLIFVFLGECEFSLLVILIVTVFLLIDNLRTGNTESLF